MHADIAGQGCGDMPAIALVAEAALFNILQRQTRNDGDAVIARLSRHRLMLVTGLAQRLRRKVVVEAFDFLKAENVRALLVEKPPHQIDP